MLEISLFKVIVFCTGVLLCLGCIIGALIYDKKTNDGGSDERQKIVYGECGTYSFATMMFINAVSYLAVTRLRLPFNMNVMFLCSILLGGMSYVLCGIWKDALFTRIWTKKKWIIIMIVWVLLIAYTTLGYTRKGIIDNLILSITESIIFIIVMINLAAKILYNKKQEKLDAQEE